MLQSLLPASKRDRSGVFVTIRASLELLRRSGKATAFIMDVIVRMFFRRIFKPCELVTKEICGFVEKSVLTRLLEEKGL